MGSWTRPHWEWCGIVALAVAQNAVATPLWRRADFPGGVWGGILLAMPFVGWTCAALAERWAYAGFVGFGMRSVFVLAWARAHGATAEAFPFAVGVPLFAAALEWLLLFNFGALMARLLGAARGTKPWRDD